MLPRWPYDEKPLLVFWETTKACLLACRHCRAEAITTPLPGELNTKEAISLIDQVVEFGKPYPVMIFTGGDPLMRKDLWILIDYARSQGLRVGLAPSITPLLTEETIAKIKSHGVSSVSISLDSADPRIHDNVRGIEGTWKRTVEILKLFKKHGVRVQVNTVVMRSTVNELPYMVKLLKDIGIDTWEVFYLIPIGRAGREEDLTPDEWEDVTHFLYEASKYGIMIRTTEGPMFRRVSIARKLMEEQGIGSSILGLGELYHRLIDKLYALLGEPKGKPQAHTVGTRDGKGIVFISYNGDVYPSGFLPVAAGNIKMKKLAEIYRNSKLFKRLRSAEFRGRCGKCEFREICGGSRARAYAYYRDPFAEDPACPYKPGSYTKLLGNHLLEVLNTMPR